MPALETKFVFYGAPMPKDAALFSVLSAGHDVLKPPIACNRPNGWNVEALNYTLRGAGIGHIGGQRSRATAGSLWLAPKDLSFHTTVDPEVGFHEVRWIQFDGAWVRPLWAMLGLTGVTHIPACKEAGPLVDEIFALLKAHGNAALHEATAALWRLFVAAEKAMLRKEIHLDPTGQAVERARQFAQVHFAEPIGVAEMAQAACWSPFHFARVFRAKTGFTPAAYIRMLRVARAQELLRLGELGTKQIAQAVGLPAVPHFSAVFKKATGITPHEFARSHAGG